MKTDINVKSIFENLTNPIKYFSTFFNNVVIVLQINKLVYVFFFNELHVKYC
jgi:hypothetical protein